MSGAWVAAWLVLSLPTGLGRVTGSPPGIVIDVAWPGAAPADVDAQVVRPLAGALRAVEDLEHLGSTATSGRATLELQLGARADALVGMRRVADAIRAVDLPADAERPILRLSERRAARLIVVAPEAADAAERALERVPRVQAVEICGGRRERLIVQIDPARAAAFGLTREPLAATLRAAVPNARTHAELEALALRIDVRLADVAVLRTEAAPGCRCWRAGRPAICLRITGDATAWPPGLSPLPLAPSRPIRATPGGRGAVRAPELGLLWLDADGEGLWTGAAEASEEAGRTLRAQPGLGVGALRPADGPVTRLEIVGTEGEAREAAAREVRARWADAAWPVAPPPLSEISVVVAPEAGRLGVSATAVAQAVRDAVDGRRVGAVRRSEGELPVWLRWGDPADNPASLQALRLSTPGGAEVSLASVATLREATAPAALLRCDGVPCDRIDLLGIEAAAARAVLAGIELPAGVSVTVEARR